MRLELGVWQHFWRHSPKISPKTEAGPSELSTEAIEMKEFTKAEGMGREHPRKTREFWGYLRNACKMRCTWRGFGPISPRSG